MGQSAGFLGINPDFSQTLDQFRDDAGNFTGADVANGILSLGRKRGVPNTRVRLTHAFTLRDKRNRIIGAAYKVAMKQGRDSEDVFEVDANGHGRVREVVMGNLTTRTLSLSRYDLYTAKFEEAFGTQDLTVLTNQRAGLSLREHWNNPVGVFTSGRERWQYQQCWFTDIERAKGADDDRVVRVTGTLKWTDRIRIT